MACRPFLNTRLMQKIIAFLKEVKTEMRQVNWPTRSELVKYTLVVVLFSVALAAFLGGLDFVFAWILNKLIF